MNPCYSASSLLRQGLIAVLGLALLSHPASAAAPAVSDVRAAQIPGMHQVKITYNLVADAPCTIALLASTDGGTSYPLVIDGTAIVAGSAHGSAVPAGTGKSITVDASKVTALQKTFTKQLKFRVDASGGTTPPPVGYGDMVRIEAGNFQMGDQSNPLVGYSEELPVHTVYLSAFYMAKYETTKELWDEVRAWGTAPGRGYDLAAGNGGYASKGANHPVHSVSWYDVVKWCNARSEKENLVPCYTVAGATYRTGQSDAVVCNFAASGYRLPTEAEWERTARGSGQTGYHFPWGNNINHDMANYINGSYSYESPQNQGYHPLYAKNGYPYTSPVGSFAPSHGLHDMAGNVWEWCWDRYGGYTAGLQTNPTGAPSGSYRVGRGGGWGGDASYCRVAFRYRDFPSNSYNSVGLRPARSSVP